jgi:integrase
MLPESLIIPLQEHVARVQRVHAQDVAQRYGAVLLPFALARTYPNADRLWLWPDVFPAHQWSKDSRTGIIRRHHAHERGLQRAVSRVSRAAGLTTRLSGHPVRHRVATHLLQ